MSEIKDKIISEVYHEFYGSIKDTFTDAKKKDKTITYDDVKKNGSTITSPERPT